MARLAPSLNPPIFAGTLPLSRAVPPDPQGKPSSPHCPVLPSDPFVSWATQPVTLSLCPLAHQATHSATGHSVRSGLEGRNSNFIRGPLFQERRRSFTRDPLTPLARPGSIRPLAGTPLSYLRDGWVSFIDAFFLILNEGIKMRLALTFLVTIACTMS